MQPFISTTTTVQKFSLLRMRQQYCEENLELSQPTSHLIQGMSSFIKLSPYQQFTKNEPNRV